MDKQCLALSQNPYLSTSNTTKDTLIRIYMHIYKQKKIMGIVFWCSLEASARNWFWSMITLFLFIYFNKTFSKNFKRIEKNKKKTYFDV